ncbi:MAG: CBS and ACT domain-containing protein [Eubacteriales bacterium]|nr:CBS and ACT domain-containing protein [Eubacteriales bacterium]MDD3198869.1 CBS and ACT domain-containing protein [Eubacteriales bacterium]MDD4122567.1 CBS and ACT domain-containing protein [Eubacteriales bacterium]MDD4629232.1 CBS and ACT domain-containing protein [Eubacteriales bacterium]
MYVKNRMTTNPYTIAFDAPITEVIELMREKNLKRLPVVNKDKVVGMLTQGDIQKVSPTKATTLSIYELNYLLAKTKVSDAMTKEVISISPDSLLEEAAVLMRDSKVGALVVMKDGKLTGIITESDIFEAFIDLMGFRETGSRITIQAKDVPGVLADIGEIFNALDLNITHIAVYRQNSGYSDVVIRTSSLNTDTLEQKLIEHGYIIENVIRNEG